jgi:predicted CxxxxCH...CXXCH cytochrome family protein
MTSPTYVSGACSSNYCHGKYSTSTYGGATTPSPAWGTAGKLWCDSCHGDPPVRRTDGVTAHTTSTACSACHSGYADKGADSSPRGVNIALHLNATAEVTPPSGGSDCSICHDEIASAMRSTTSGYHHLMSNSAATANFRQQVPTSAVGDATDPGDAAFVPRRPHV